MITLKFDMPQSRATCARKVRYRHHGTALNAVTMMAAKDIVGLEAYECEFCAGWHIGHPAQVVIAVEVAA